MKNNRFFSLLLISFIFTGCASVSTKSGYVNLPQKNTFYNVNEISIKVSKDQIPDNQVSEQLKGIIFSMIPCNYNAESEKVLLEITINQRAFLKDVRQLNSIYVTFTLKNKDGSILMNKGLYKETTSSIVSAVEQYNISTFITSEINSFFNNSLKVEK